MTTRTQIPRLGPVQQQALNNLQNAPAGTWTPGIELLGPNRSWGQHAQVLETLHEKGLVDRVPDPKPGACAHDYIINDNGRSAAAAIQQRQAEAAEKQRLAAERFRQEWAAKNKG